VSESYFKQKIVKIMITCLHDHYFHSNTRGQFSKSRMLQSLNIDSFLLEETNGVVPSVSCVCRQPGPCPGSDASPEGTALVLTSLTCCN